MKNLTVGEKVYVATNYAHDVKYYAATVVKTTPSGAFTVKTDYTETLIRFTNNGKAVKEPGKFRHDYWLDTYMTFDERTAFINREERLRAAVSHIRNLTIRNGLNERWGKEGLTEEVNRLQEFLDIAKRLVDSI